MRVRFLGILVAVVALAFVLAGWHWLVVHFMQETGISDTSSRAYSFWSGFGSDIGEASIIVGIVGAYRHHNCHVIRCLRLGKPVEGTPYVACPRHHPAHKGDRRGVALDTVHNAYVNRRNQ